MSAAKRVALGGCMVALALALSYVESLFPAILPSIPGVKLGLANVVTVILLYTLKERAVTTAAIVTVLRVVLAGLLFSGVWAMIYALSGAVVSLLVMLLLKRLPFSVLGISIAGGTAHNIAQLCVAAIVLGDGRLFSLYYPALIIAGVAAGTITGLAAAMVIKFLAK